eukprot:10561748-Alexandrium_andersonii.AAC.1
MRPWWRRKVATPPSRRMLGAPGAVGSGAKKHAPVFATLRQVPATGMGPSSMPNGRLAPGLQACASVK